MAGYHVHQNTKNRPFGHESRGMNVEPRQAQGVSDFGKGAAPAAHMQPQHQHTPNQHHQQVQEQREGFYDYTGISAARNNRNEPPHNKGELPHARGELQHSRGEPSPQIRTDLQHIKGEVRESVQNRGGPQQNRGDPTHSRSESHHLREVPRNRIEPLHIKSEPPTIRNVSVNSEVFHPNPRQPERIELKPKQAPSSSIAKDPSLHHSSRYGSGDRPSEGGGGNIPRVTASSFDQMREEHARRGINFEDKSFLPNDASLYFSSVPPYRINWKRPEKVSAPYKPNFVVDGYETTDVRQGALGDCWFVAAMACICGPDNYPILNRVIPPGQSFETGWYGGMFRFNFWQFGEWREVIVDDLLPTVHENGQDNLIFVNSTDRMEFWPALMEKAYAKLYGSYEALKGGWMSDSLTDLTGGVSEVYVLRGKRANYPPNLVNIVLKALEHHALIGSGIDDVEGAGPESLLPNGLVTGHAYSVTNIKKIFLMSDRGREPVFLIRIRNPHGDYKEWNGLWRDDSEKWRDVRPADLAQLGLTRRDDGEFWMDFQDFLRNFDELVICNLTPDTPIEMPRKWFVEEHNGRWVKNFNAGGSPSQTGSHWANPQYVLRLEDTDDDDDSVCSVIVQLMQKDRRKIKQLGETYHFIGFVIYKLPRGIPVPLKKDFFEQNAVFLSSGSFINTRQVVKRFALPPGDYVVVPCTYEVDKEADYYIRFFFEKGNVSEYADDPPGKVDIPPPTPSPKQKDQDDEFKQFFYKMSGEDMELDPFELQIAVNDGLKKEPLHRNIGLDACKSFVSLMDVDNSGQLGFTEFQFLWGHLRSWKKTFVLNDVDNSGKMDSRELRTALGSLGYKISNQMLAAMVFRYADANGQISLDDFLVLMARLMKLFNVFHKRQKDDQAVFTLQEWVEESLRI